MAAVLILYRVPRERARFESPSEYHCFSSFMQRHKRCLDFSSRPKHQQDINPRGAAPTPIPARWKSRWCSPSTTAKYRRKLLHRRGVTVKPGNSNGPYVPGVCEGHWGNMRTAQLRSVSCDWGFWQWAFPDSFISVFLSRVSDLSLPLIWCY